jgi:hypothetical protein
VLTGHFGLRLCARGLMLQSSTVTLWLNPDCHHCPFQVYLMKRPGVCGRLSPKGAQDLKTCPTL